MKNQQKPLPSSPSIAVIIPVFNEADSIGLVLSDLPNDQISEIVVVDNGSTDTTHDVVRDFGATLLHQSERGYGAACLLGVEYVLERDFDIVVFLDGDYSDHPDELPQISAPLLEDRADLVIGARVRELREPGAMPPQAIFGNWLATTLIRIIWRYRFRDLGPFRGITADALRRLQMADRDFGWTVEMQVKAAKMGLRTVEVPVRYRRRIGVSKISGTIKGSVRAGIKILYVIGRSLFRS